MQMNYRLLTLACLMLATVTTTTAQNRRQRGQRQAFQTDPVMAHDPVMAFEDGKYYLLATGMGISRHPS